VYLKNPALAGFFFIGSNTLAMMGKKGAGPALMPQVKAL
jgi:hypothetical protein